MTLASRMSRIAPSPTLRVAAEADRLRRQGIDVVDLGAGEPDFPTPEHVKTAAHAAIDANFTKYTPSAGVKELRDAVCLRYRDDYGVELKTEEVIITAGAKQALYNAAMSLFEAGDEVITHAPFWPTIPEQIKLAGATPVIVQTHPEDGFTIHAQPIIDAITPRTKGVVINSPCNPTGALMSEEAIGAIADAAARHGLWIVADVTYEKLVYDAEPHNLVRVLVERARDRTIICGAASKAYAMTGWRCGWAIGTDKDHHRVQCGAGAFDVECRVDHAEGGDRRAHRTAGRARTDARRIQEAPRRGVGVADRRSPLHLPEAARRVLPLSQCD